MFTRACMKLFVFFCLTVIPSIIFFAFNGSNLLRVYMKYVANIDGTRTGKFMNLSRKPNFQNDYIPFFGRTDFQNMGFSLLKTKNCEVPISLETHITIQCTKEIPLFVSKKFINRTSHLNGSDRFVVPNIVHFIAFTQNGQPKRLTFLEYLSFLAAEKIQKPKQIYLHANKVPVGFWWDKLVQDIPNLFFVHQLQPEHVFGLQIKQIQHKADVIKLVVMIEYGGIYLDPDVLILKSLDTFRKYNMTLGVEGTGVFNNGLIIAKQNSTFLHYWLKGYTHFNPNCWTCSSLELPYRLWKQFPDLVYNAGFSLVGKAWENSSLLYKEGGYDDWAKNYAIHIFGKDFYPVPKSPEQLYNSNVPIKQMMKYIYEYT